jgi:lysylphosphatidylglycerol synthetase-like protein (DUF2156 family)
MSNKLFIKITKHNNMKKYLHLLILCALALYPLSEPIAMIEYRTTEIKNSNDTTVSKNTIKAEKRIRTSKKLFKIGLYFAWFFYITIILWFIAYLLIFPYRNYENAQAIYKKLKFGMQLCLALIALMAFFVLWILFIIPPK